MAYKILKHINSNKVNRKYRIPKSSNDNQQEWVEIEMDFKAKRFKSIILNELDWVEYNDATFPSSLLNEFLRSEYPKSIKCDYVSGLNETGKITPQMLVKWAYLENGYFLDQDEDLIMYKPELIETMHDLMIDEYSNRKLDLFKILKNYSKQVFVSGKDKAAIRIFNKLEKVKSDEIYHIELIKHIIELKRTS